MKLTDQQLRFYRTFGFLKFPGLFGSDIERITEAFEEIWAATGRTHDRMKRSMLIPFVDRNEYLCGLLDDERIDGVAASVLGDDYNYASSDGNYYVGDTKWHSDKDPGETHESFKIAFYLDPVTPDTGCLRVIPGGGLFGGDEFSTALHEAVPFTSASKPEEFWGVSGAEVPAYAIQSHPGDMLLFNHKLKHSSWGGSDRRRMFTYNFEARYREDELPMLRQLIADQANYGNERAYGETMIRTAGPGRMRHLAQRLENDGHLAGLVAEAKKGETA